MQSHSKLSVLIIDDDENILTVLSKLLEKLGCTVTTTETGQKALDKIKNEKYCVALIDVRLQDVNGLDLLSQIHKIAPTMVKIVLTGYPSDEDRAIALERGADDYLIKPVKPEELIDVVQNKVRKRRDSGVT